MRIPVARMSRSAFAKELVLPGGKRSGKIARLHGEVFTADEVRLNGSAVGRQMMQQSPEAGERRKLLQLAPTSPAILGCPIRRKGVGFDPFS
jgi:hypothetical protein